MQLSRDEFLRVSVLREDRRAGFSTGTMPANFAVAPASAPSAPAPTPATREAQQIADTVDEMPEMRDEIVASLRARIESGTYHVSSEAIAEMMLRRMMADRVG